MSDNQTESQTSSALVPRVVLLPDSCFFIRSIEVEKTQDAAVVEAQVDLTLETISPFPVTQLLYGHHWLPGEGRALVFAAYRRRFSSDELEAWSQADWVAPELCAHLGRKMKAGATLVITHPTHLTALHWGQGAVPDKVACRPLGEAWEQEKRDQVRNEVLAEVGASDNVIDCSEAPEILPAGQKGELLFRVGTEQLSLEEALASRHDVRPLEVLEALRKAKRKDLMLWRLACALVLGLGVLLAGEGVLFGVDVLHKNKIAQRDQQQPIVSKIESSQALAFRIDELATKRLLPFEMITLLMEKKPRSVQFVKTTTGLSNPGRNSMRIEAQTSNPDDLSAFQAALTGHPSIDSVEVSDQKLINRSTRFTMQVNFKPGALKAATP